MYFNQSDGYYSNYFKEGPKCYEYCLKSDVDSLCKSKTLPRSMGSTVDIKGPKVHPRNVCFYGVEDDISPFRKRPHNTFVVTADVEPHR